MNVKHIAIVAFATLTAVATPAIAQVTALTSAGQIPTSYINDFETGVKNSGPVTFDSGSRIVEADAYATSVTSSGAFGLGSGGYPGVITANLSNSYNEVGLYFGNDDRCCSNGFSAVLSVYNGATLLGSVNVAANMNDFADQFIGLSSVTAFDRVTIDYGQAGLYTFIDDFRLGTVAAVPETATWGMMIAGFGMMGAALRTRRRSAKVTFA